MHAELQPSELSTTGYPPKDSIYLRAAIANDSNLVTTLFKIRVCFVLLSEIPLKKISAFVVKQGLPWVHEKPLSAFQQNKTVCTYYLQCRLCLVALLLLSKVKGILERFLSGENNIYKIFRQLLWEIIKFNKNNILQVLRQNWNRWRLRWIINP